MPRKRKPDTDPSGGEFEVRIATTKAHGQVVLLVAKRPGEKRQVYALDASEADRMGDRLQRAAATAMGPTSGVVH